MSARPAELRHLGDFTTSQRVLLIVALALPIGALSAGVAWALLRLIGLITNLVFYQRATTALVAPGGGHHPVELILLAPVVGGLLIGLMARYGSEKIRGHGIPEAIESILVSGSKVQPRVALLKPISCWRRGGATCTRSATANASCVPQAPIGWRRGGRQSDVEP